MLGREKMLKFRSKDKDKHHHAAENGKSSHTDSKSKGGGMYCVMKF